jgi:hypothetical protein
MIKNIFEASASDLQLSAILDATREFAYIYVLARQRQKGCDGMGELATMKEEFRDVVDKVIHYHKEKKYISEGDIRRDSEVLTIQNGCVR